MCRAVAARSAHLHRGVVVCVLDVVVVLGLEGGEQLDLQSERRRVHFVHGVCLRVLSHLPWAPRACSMSAPWICLTCTLHRHLDPRSTLRWKFAPSRAGGRLSRAAAAGPCPPLNACTLFRAPLSLQAGGAA